MRKKRSRDSLLLLSVSIKKQMIVDIWFELILIVLKRRDATNIILPQLKSFFVSFAQLVHYYAFLAVWNKTLV